MKKPLPKRTLVLGGARSGKSSFAERWIDYFSKPKVYLATAQALDDEMRARIDEHKKTRGSNWRLIEAPMQAAQALAGIAPDEAVLFDCATMWLSNQMLADADLSTARSDLLRALDDCRGQVVVVSNETGLGIVPENALARRFRDEQGALNAQLAAGADTVVFVAAGLPLVLKGKLPRGFA